MNAENKFSAAVFIKTAALLLFFGTLLFSCEKVYIIEVEKPSVEQQNDSTEYQAGTLVAQMATFMPGRTPMDTRARAKLSTSSRNSS